MEKVVQYFLTEINGFEIKKYVYDHQDYNSNIKFIGCRVEEAIQEFKKCRFSRSTRNTIENYRRIYENVSNEEVGGTLTVYHISSNGIEKFNCDIKDKNDIETFEEYQAKKANRNRVVILQGNMISNNIFSNNNNIFNELFGLRKHYRAKGVTDLNGTPFLKADDLTGKLQFNSNNQIDNAMYSKGLIVSQEKTTANSIFIGDTPDDTTIDTLGNSGCDSYSIRFVDDNDTKGRLFYKTDSSAIKLLAKNNISLEVGSSTNTVYIGYGNNGSADYSAGATIDGQCSKLTKVWLKDCKIDSDAGTMVDLKTYITNKANTAVTNLVTNNSGTTTIGGYTLEGANGITVAINDTTKKITISAANVVAKFA